LLFSYVASFLYDGDAPLAERRAQALAVDQAQLQELIGDAELRELLDPEAMHEIERQLQRLEAKYQARSVDGIHDMLIALGDLTPDELRARTVPTLSADTIQVLVAARRAVDIRLGGDTRYIAVEDAARYRDALGVPLPPGLPESLLTPAPDALSDLALRYARTHAPFPAADFAARYGLSPSVAEAELIRLTSQRRLLEGEFRPGGTRREWTDANVLRLLRRRSLARLRREVEPVEHAVLARFLSRWHGITARRRGPDALLDAIEQLQGAPLVASQLETDLLPARVDLYDPADLDAITAAGEIVWVGVESLGEHDGRVGLYLADHLPRLLPPKLGRPATELSARETAVLEHLRGHGASFFAAIHAAAGDGYPAETVDALWTLVWLGLITNDTFHPLRALTRVRASRRRDHHRRHPRPVGAFRSRRLIPPSAEVP
jgi:ATP-dependent Lhr-like helicase